jgi:hypothetical protein
MSRIGELCKIAPHCWHTAPADVRELIEMSYGEPVEFVETCCREGCEAFRWKPKTGGNSSSC